MKGLNLKSTMKKFGLVLLGASFALCTMIAPKFNVKADSLVTEEVSDDPNDNSLYINGTIVNDPDEGIVLPSKYSDKTIFKHITVGSNAVFPADAECLFKGFSNVISISIQSSNTDSTTNMSWMFQGLTKLSSVTITGINTSGVTKMTGMFDGCTSLTELDLSSFTVSQIIDSAEGPTQGISDNMGWMFNNCSKLERIVVNNNWQVNESVQGTDMFKGDIALVGGNGTKYTNPGAGDYAMAQYAKIDKEGQSGYLSSTSSLKINAGLKTDGNKFILSVSIDQGQDTSTNTYKISYGDIKNYAEFTLGGSESAPRIGSFEIKAVAKEIDVPKTLIIKKNNTEVFKNNNISVAYYLRRIAQIYTSDTSTYKIAGSMLRYGLAAQKYFNNSGSLANNGIDGFKNYNDNITSFDSFSDTSFDPAAMNTALSNAGYKDATAVTYSAMNLSFDEDLTFMMAFKVPSNSSAEYVNDSKLSALIKDKHQPDDANYSLTTGGPSYIVTMTKNINVKNLDQAVFSSADFGQDVTPVLYLYRVYNKTTNDNMRNLAIALYDFHKRAQTYPN